MSKVTEAYLEFTPILDLNAGNMLTIMATKLGHDVGDALGDGVNTEIDKNLPKLKGKGDQMGASISEGLQQRLERLNLPKIDIKADPDQANAQIDELKERLAFISHNATTAEIRVDANKALSDVNLFSKKLKDQAEDTGKDSGTKIGTGIADKLNERLSRLNLPNIDIKADPSQAERQIDELKERLALMSANATTVEVKVDTDKTLSDLERFGRSFITKTESVGAEASEKMSSGFHKNLNIGTDFGTLGTQAAILSSRMALVGGAFASAIPGIAGVASAIAPLTGLLAGIPVLALGAVAAVAPLIIAFHGLSDASKQMAKDKEAIKAYSDAVNILDAPSQKAIEDLFNLSQGSQAYTDAVKALPPELQAQVKSLQTLRGEYDTANADYEQLKESTGGLLGALDELKSGFKNLQSNVRMEMFPPLSAQIYDLAVDRLPQLSAQLDVAAGLFGKLGAKIIDTATSNRNFTIINDTIGAMVAGMSNASPAMTKLIDAFYKMAEAALPFFTLLLHDMNVMIERFADWLSQAADNGQIFQWISDAVHVVIQLVKVIEPLIKIFFTLMNVASNTGQSVLDVWAGLADQVVAFLKSAEGTQALSALFTIVSALGQALHEGLALVLPALTAAIVQLTPALLPLIPVFVQLLTAVVPLLPIITELALVLINALMPILVSFGNWIATNQDTFMALAKAVLVMVAATKAFTIAQIALNLALDANPIGAIVLLIEALVLGFIYLWKTSDSFRSFWITLWADIKLTVAVAVDFYRTWFGIASAIFEAWWHSVETYVGFIKAAFTGAVDGITAALRFLGDIFNTVFNGIQVAFSVLRGVFEPIFATWWQIVSSFGALVFWLHEQVFKVVFASISQIVQSFYADVILPVFNALSTAFAWLWNVAIQPVWEIIKTSVSDVGSFFYKLYNDWILPAFNTISGVFWWLWNVVISPFWDTLKKSLDDVGDKFKHIFGSIGDWIKDAFNGTKDWLKGAINDIIDVINSATDHLNSSVIDTMNKVPGVNFPHIPDIPKLATGGTATSDGWSIIGERGPELLHMPTGASVVPLPQNGGFGSNDDTNRKLDELIKAVKEQRKGLNVDVLNINNPTDEDMILQRLDAGRSY